MEYIRKCNVCGKIYCYSDDDVNKNSSNAAMGALSALAGLVSAFGGTVFHTTQSVHLNSLSKSYTDKMIDFNKCPECNSTNTVEISLEELKKIHNEEMNEKANEERKNKKIEINSNASAESLIKRARIYLEDAEWDNANSYAEAVLDLEPENSVAYLIKLMSELNVKNENDLFNKDIIFEGNKLYTKIVRYSDEDFVRKFKEHDENLRKIRKDEYEKEIEKYEKEIENNYQYALKLKEKAKTKSEIRKAIDLFYQNSTYKNSKELINELKDKLDIIEKEKNYNDAKQYMEMGTIESYEKAINYFNDCKEWEDSKELIQICKAKITEIKEEQEKKEKKIRIIGIVIIIIVAIISIIKGFIIPNNKYNKAMNFIEEENYQSAINELEEIKFYKDSAYLIDEIQEKKEKYNKALNLLDEKSFSYAMSLFEELGNYQDSEAKLELATNLYNIKYFNNDKCQTYFENNKEDFEIISDDETIRKLLTGKWYERNHIDYYNYMNLGKVAILSSDGTATARDNSQQTFWVVKGGYLYFDSIWYTDKQNIESPLHKKEVRKIADGVFLLIDFNGKADSILISEDSEYAGYLK